jgi:hypothetical protein
MRIRNIFQQRLQHISSCIVRRQFTWLSTVRCCNRSKVEPERVSISSSYSLLGSFF